MKPAVAFVAALSLLFLAGNCGKSGQDSLGNQVETYHQDFSDNAAVIVIERNGVPWISSSGFVADRENGLLLSAKHAVGVEGKDSGKIFLNGRVYDGMLVQTPAAIDAGKFQITSRFDPRDLPEPYKIGGPLKKGDAVFIKGLHPHPPGLREEKMPVPIYSGHYKMSWVTKEYVFDVLEAKVVNVAKVGSYNMGRKKEDGGLEVASVYIELKTKEDHRFSFGGLSGGPVVNEKNELIGIVAQEMQAHYELLRESLFLVYHPWETIFIVPIQQLEDSGFIQSR